MATALHVSATARVFPVSCTLVAGTGAGGVLEVVLAGAHRVHDGVEDAELAGSERADHDATRGQADSGELDKADFFGDVHETSGSGASAACTGLVDLGQQSVGGVGDDGGNNTGDDA